MPPGVGPGVAFAAAACGPARRAGSTICSPSVSARTESSSPSRNVLDHDLVARRRRARRRSSMARGDAGGLGAGGADDRALAGREPRRLDDERLGVARRCSASAGASVGEGAGSRRSGRRRRRITSLANALDDSSRAAAGGGPERRRGPPARSRSASPAASGASGPTTTRSMRCSRAAAGEAVEVGGGDGEVGGELRRCRGCPGPRTGSSSGSSRCSAQQQGVLAAAPADDQDPHFFFDGVGERLGGALGRIDDVVDDGLGFLHVVLARVVDVLVERAAARLGSAARVLAAQDAVVVARLRPSAAARRRARVLNGCVRIERARGS